MRIFVKLSSLILSLLIVKILTISNDKMDGKRNIRTFFGDTLHKLIFYRQINAGNVILYQIKVFGRNIKETTLARHFIKVIARPWFIKFITFIKY